MNQQKTPVGIEAPASLGPSKARHDPHGLLASTKRYAAAAVAHQEVIKLSALPKTNNFEPGSRTPQRAVVAAYWEEKRDPKGRQPPSKAPVGPRPRWRWRRKCTASCRLLVLSRSGEQSRLTFMENERATAGGCGIFFASEKYV